MVNKDCDSRFGQMKPEVNVTEINATPLNRTVNDLISCGCLNSTDPLMAHNYYVMPLSMPPCFWPKGEPKELVTCLHGGRS